MAFSMSTSTVSVLDFVASVSSKVSLDGIYQAFQDAASSLDNGILGYEEEPLDSIDFKGHAASSIVDAQSTMAIDGDTVKAVSWCANEWGYPLRTAELRPVLAEEGL